MQKKLNKVMFDIFNLKEEGVDNASMGNVRNWDSLKHIELIIVLEEEFGVAKFTPDEIVKMTNIPGIKDVLRRRGVNI